MKGLLEQLSVIQLAWESPMGLVYESGVDWYMLFEGDEVDDIDNRLGDCSDVVENAPRMLSGSFMPPAIGLM